MYLIDLDKAQLNEELTKAKKEMGNIKKYLKENDKALEEIKKNRRRRYYTIL
jgi:hypothetical protein